MPTMTLRYVPVELHVWSKQQARAHHRCDAAAAAQTISVTRTWRAIRWPSIVPARTSRRTVSGCIFSRSAMSVTDSIVSSRGVAMGVGSVVRGDESV